MPTIIALNPRPKARGRKKKTMAKSKKRRPMTALQKKYFGTKSQRKEAEKTMAKGKKKTTKKRKNPSKGKSIRRYTKQTLGGVNMMGAAKSTVPLLFGALAAKFAAKKFADGGAESDNWNYKNYLLAAAGAFVAAFGTSALLRKRAAAQKVFEGGLLLIAYKIFTNEIAPMNQYTDSWFSGNEDLYDPYSGYDAGEPGDIWQGNNEDYVKGIDGYWRPVSESHRLPARSMGDVMVNPEPRYGDVMVNPDPRYGGMGLTSEELDKMIEADGM